MFGILIIVLAFGAIYTVYKIIISREVNGGFSEWGDCITAGGLDCCNESDIECMDGAIETRTCTNPKPSKGGKSCKELKLGSSIRSCKNTISICQKEDAQIAWNSKCEKKPRGEEPHPCPGDSVIGIQEGTCIKEGKGGGKTCAETPKTKLCELACTSNCVVKEYIKSPCVFSKECKNGEAIGTHGWERTYKSKQSGIGLPCPPLKSPGKCQKKCNPCTLLDKNKCEKYGNTNKYYYKNKTEPAPCIVSELSTRKPCTEADMKNYGGGDSFGCDSNTRVNMINSDIKCADTNHPQCPIGKCILKPKTGEAIDWTCYEGETTKWLFPPNDGKSSFKCITDTPGTGDECDPKTSICKGWTQAGNWKTSGCFTFPAGVQVVNSNAGSPTDIPDDLPYPMQDNIKNGATINEVSMCIDPSIENGSSNPPSRYHWENAGKQCFSPQTLNYTDEVKKHTEPKPRTPWTPGLAIDYRGKCNIWCGCTNENCYFNDGTFKEGPVCKEFDKKVGYTNCGLTWDYPKVDKMVWIYNGPKKKGDKAYNTKLGGVKASSEITCIDDETIRFIDFPGVYTNNWKNCGIAAMTEDTSTEAMCDPFINNKTVGLWKVKKKELEIW